MGFLFCVREVFISIYYYCILLCTINICNKIKKDDKNEENEDLDFGFSYL